MIESKNIKKLPRSEIILNYFIVYILMGFSGTFFFSFKDELLVVVFLLFIYMFFKKGMKIDHNFQIFILYCSTIVIGQSIIFGSMSIIGITRGFITIILGYVVIKLIGKNFTKYFVNIVYFFAIISFFFYFPSLIFKNVHSFLATVADKLGTDAFGYNEWGYHGNNFIIYTWRDWTKDGLLRNTGNYTEAGAFGSFLVIAFMLNIIEKKTLVSKKNFVFAIAIITTFSTSCYIAFFFLIFFWLSITMSSVKKILFYPIVITIFLYLFSSLPFLQDKIETNYENETTEVVKSGRFASALIDLKDVSKYPLTGRGFSKETRSDTDWSGGSNGFTGLLVTIAPIGFLLYFFYLFKSINNYCTYNNVSKQFSYMAILVIILLAFAQYILSTPFLYSLVFSGGIYINEEINDRTENICNNTQL